VWEARERATRREREREQVFARFADQPSKDWPVNPASPGSLVNEAGRATREQWSRRQESFTFFLDLCFLRFLLFNIQCPVYRQGCPHHKDPSQSGVVAAALHSGASRRTLHD
jgi:hypothetical protein